MNQESGVRKSSIRIGNKYLTANGYALTVADFDGPDTTLLTDEGEEHRCDWSRIDNGLIPFGTRYMEDWELLHQGSGPFADGSISSFEQMWEKL
jgi:hypothetical protein